MKRALLLAAVVLALGASEAGAKTTIIAPPGSPYPYQRWVDESKVPTPDITLTVVEDSSACVSGASACTSQISNTIWLNPAFSADRETILHELGHHVDYRVLTDWRRWRFQSLIGDRGRPWTEGPNASHEKFAEAFMWCARYFRLRRAPSYWGYKYRPTPRLHRRVCHLIRAAAAH